MSRRLALAALVLAFPVAARAQQVSSMSHSAGHPTTFTVRVENVSTGTTLRLSNGQTAPAPTAPVLWVVHTGTNPVFIEGRRDAGIGLERLAETGDPSDLAAALQGGVGIVRVGGVNMPMGDMAPGPITPGKAYEFQVTAEPGQKLSLAFMFGQSNDLFYAPRGQGIALFNTAGAPIGGDMTDQLVLWDAGTEVNEEPGLGPNQAPRQSAPDAGTPERKAIRAVHDRYSYPATAQVVRLTITPTRAMGAM